MTKLTIYNHKGGVGKTTLTVNIAAALGAAGKRVLLLDTDPQCNLTSYLLADDVVNELLEHSDSKGGETIWTSLKPVFDGDGDVRAVEPVEVPIDNVALLPGDIRLSEYEQFLGDAWNDCFKRRLGGLRAISSISRVAEMLAEKGGFDFVFYDTGPNIGPLNRVLLLDSDYFIVPVACDLFSERALSTLGQTLKSWITDWETIRTLAPDDAELLIGRPKFMGFIPQRFRVYGQEMAQQPSYYLRRIERKIFSDVISVLRSVGPELAKATVTDSKLGQVKSFGGLVELAQRQGVALADVVGGDLIQKEEAASEFEKIAHSIAAIATRHGSGKKPVIKRKPSGR